MDTTTHYQKIKLQRTTLAEQYPDGVCFLASIANATSGAAGGSVCAASLDVAAKCLTEGTHRIASAGEVADYETLQDNNRKYNLSVERRRDTKPFLFMAPRRQGERV